MTERNSRSTIEYINNEAGTRLGLHYYGGNTSNNAPVILSHGTFSNHRSCRGLAHFLSQQGFDCWVLDFQGHGSSDSPAWEPDFESMCLQDTEAVLDFILRRYPNRLISWVGHSGGGLAILMFLARAPQWQNCLASITTLASQATDAGLNPVNRQLIRVASVITAILRVAPGKWLKLGPENEYAAVMQQWYGWSLKGRWEGVDGFDYLQALPKLKTPLLSIAAGADNFIAPTSGCRKLHEYSGGVQKSWQLCSREHGFREDYTHARIISSRSAASDVWPLVLNWVLRFAL